jgi:S1-C subfamily serine protease
VSDRDPVPTDETRPRSPRALILLLALAAAAIAGGFIGRGLAPSPTQMTTAPGRPIVQIVRQPSFPSLGSTIDRLCPSMARIVPAGQQGGSPAPALPGSAAFVVSADGWLVTSAPLPANSNLQAIFGDGRQSAVDDARPDPVSGLTILHVAPSGLIPLTFSNQSFARVGDFGFSLQTSGTGCAASASMIGSDFLVDSLAQGIFVRLQPGGESLPAGTPFFAGDGAVLGVATNVADNALLPGPIAAVIVDELIRNSLSPIASFGFRAIDFTAELANRVGEQRARGAGVALVQPKSAAEKAGLRAGDIVIAVNGSPVSSASELSRALDAVTDSAILTVARGDRQLTMTVSRSIRQQP